MQQKIRLEQKIKIKLFSLTKSICGASETVYYETKEQEGAFLGAMMSHAYFIDSTYGSFMMAHMIASLIVPMDCSSNSSKRSHESRKRTRRWVSSLFISNFNFKSYH